MPEFQVNERGAHQQHTRHEEGHHPIDCIQMAHVKEEHLADHDREQAKSEVSQATAGLFQSPEHQHEREDSPEHGNSAAREAWQFVFDDSKPTCRSNQKTYNDEDAAAHNWQYHVIDGFIISPNIEKISVNVIDEDFQNSDHNPVFMTFMLK